MLLPKFIIHAIDPAFGLFDFRLTTIQSKYAVLLRRTISNMAEKIGIARHEYGLKINFVNWGVHVAFNALGSSLETHGLYTE